MKRIRNLTLAATTAAVIALTPGSALAAGKTPPQPKISVQLPKLKLADVHAWLSKPMTQQVTAVQPAGPNSCTVTCADGTKRTLTGAARCQEAAHGQAACGSAPKPAPAATQQPRSSK